MFIDFKTEGLGFGFRVSVPGLRAPKSMLCTHYENDCIGFWFVRRGFWTLWV